MLAQCPEKPDMMGVVTPAGNVEISMATAVNLKKYLEELEICGKSNVVILDGHIEKLEARLRALGGK